MATVTKEILLDCHPDEAWEALRDWGAVDRRLAPGFLTDARVEGEDRVITFFNGTKVRELFVGVDQEGRRLAWAVQDGSMGLTHYNASAQVVPRQTGGTRFVWTADLLPHDLALTVAGLIDQGLAAIKRTLDGDKNSIS
jgi:hypothetical protein